MPSLHAGARIVERAQRRQPLGKESGLHLFRHARVRQIVRTTKSLPIAQKQAGWSRLQMAYLTVSEIFPVEMRAIAISLFYAAGTALGGFIGPPLYGAIIESGSREALFGAYAFGSGGVTDLWQQWCGIVHQA